MFTAAIHFTGNISAGSIGAVIVGVIGLATTLAQTSQIRARQAEIHDKVDSVDRAVNGKSVDQQTLRENVQDLHDQHVADGDNDRPPFPPLRGMS
jgi:hypothetical protein